jgi:phosphatidylinositol 4-kinase
LCELGLTCNCSRNIRRDAIEKLARLSAQSPAADTASFDGLYKRCPTAPEAHNGNNEENVIPVAHIGMKVPELEAIIALCKAAPFVQSTDLAEQLLNRLSLYLPDSYAQVLVPSPSLRGIDPSPQEILTRDLTSAILSIGVRHERLRAQTSSVITRYIQGWSASASRLSTAEFDNDERADFTVDGELAQVMTQSMSLLGFLDAAAEQAVFWSANERVQMIEDIRAALSEKFLIAFETALSTVRNARSHQHGLREWKRHVKHYIAVGRPLGAMILHDSFLKLVVACASLLVRSPDITPQEPILDFLRSSLGHSQLIRATSEDALVEGLTKISIEEMGRLENDLDYLQRVGSAWQQRQASAVKAKILTTYLCCTVYDEDIADVDVLLSWVDSTLNDPVQTADFDLASVALKLTAILAKLDSSVAAGLGKTLPRVIVQGGFDHRTSTVAAECLASILILLPQDVIITTLYSLGNVVSAGPVSDPSATTSPTNGNGKASRNTMYNDETGSAISLTPSDAEEPHHVHVTVVESIIAVARNCNDVKITALALTMLVQKIGRASKVVDTKIIADVAVLGVYSAENDFRLLIKHYSRLSHDALVGDDRATLEAVS